jgi:hypothetical protein
MDTQLLIQYSLVNNIPLGIQLPNGNNLIHQVLLNNDKLKTEFNKLNVIKFLVQNEVNPDEPNRDNQTPIHIACQKQYKERNPINKKAPYRGTFFMFGYVFLFLFVSIHFSLFNRKKCHR